MVAKSPGSRRRTRGGRGGGSDASRGGRSSEPGEHLLGYDAAFKRMWEYYLSCGIAAAAVSTSAVFQVLFAKSHTLPVPLRRV